MGRKNLRSLENRVNRPILQQSKVSSIKERARRRQKKRRMKSPDIWMTARLTYVMRAYEPVIIGPSIFSHQVMVKVQKAIMPELKWVRDRFR